MMLATLSSVGVQMGGIPLLDEVSFSIRRGERWAVVGRNGSGKTTIMDVLRGLRRPDDGTVSRSQGLRITVMDQDRDLGAAVTVWDAAAAGFAELFELEASLQKQLDAIGIAGADVGEAELERYSEDQERFEHSGGYLAHARVDSVLTGLGFDPEGSHSQRVETLSGGERGRLSLARQLVAPADLLILDEPTNHLDLPTIDWLEGYLRELESAVIIISHDRAFLAALADHVLHLESGTAEVYEGGWDAFLDQRAARRLASARAVKKQAATLAAEEDYIRRNIAGQNSSQAKGRRRRLERVKRLTPPPGEAGAMAVSFEVGSRGGDQVLVVDRCVVGIDGRVLVSPWSGILRRQEIVGLVGANGSGKSTLLKTVLGESAPLEGSVRMMPAAEVAYYRQDLGDVDPSASIYDLVANRRAMWTRGQVQGHLGRFGFSGDEVLRRCGTLSGGERARVALALMVLERANLLVFDEPTNHLDVESIEALEDALSAYEGTVLLVSHDRALLRSLTTRIWSIEDQRLVDFPGGFADWEIHQRGARRHADEEGGGSATGRNADPRAAAKAAAAEQRRLTRQLADSEATVARLEGELEVLEARLADPDLYLTADGPEVAKEAVDQRVAVKAALKVALKEWEKAGSALESRQN